MKKIAILYICTGKYVVFWSEFFKSAEQYLLTDCIKEYFVFTDAEKIEGEDSGRVHKIYQQSLPWPYPTLFRFKFFKSIEEQLKKFDFIYFFNSNIEILKPISAEDFLPAENEEGLVVTRHAGFWNRTNMEFTYDRNPESLAYIPFGEGQMYVAGGLNGGRRDIYLKFIDDCYNNVEEDLKKGIIALWHDESHLNKYILNLSPKILHPGYIYTEGQDIPFEKVILARNKKKYIKGYGKYSLWHKLKRFFKLV